ncbi:hypothetical protein DPMN_056852 [Dreissena polymorpha]|uniref:Uncharacterized protein n=1 Tax=Dreissena polymorpha TaxID=45954 RepID=A0A9D4CV78_DREPO|nr:hypothetical protein DPMN_056852 [Dreissena polymorpha]
MADAMIIMDHTYIKGERVSGFQVIGSRSGPDHIYSSCAPKDSSNEEARGQCQLPQDKHLHMNIKGLNWMKKPDTTNGPSMRHPF